jgi:hypothetical protein
MEPVLVGLALGGGALYLVKRGRGVVHATVGWTARKTGWLASRVRLSIDETRAVAREQYERGRREAAVGVPVVVASQGVADPAPPPSDAARAALGGDTATHAAHAAHAGVAPHPASTAASPPAGAAVTVS